MKLTIGNVPGWWTLEERTGWQYYEPRFDMNESCLDINLVKEFACYVDVGAQAATELTNTEWIYKIYNYNVDKLFEKTFGIIGEGVSKEFHAFGEMLHCFPCG